MRRFARRLGLPMSLSAGVFLLMEAQNAGAESPQAGQNPAGTSAQHSAQHSAQKEVEPTTPPLSLSASLAGLKGQGALYAQLAFSSEGKPLGSVLCELFPDKAPQAVAAFVGLARGLVAWKDPHSKTWVKKPLYDGLLVHRTVADVLIQAGDPKCFGDALCMFAPGTGEPGFVLPDEIHPEHRFEAGGSLAMASRGLGTAGSQFFVTLKPTTWLAGKHTVFGTCDGLPLLGTLSRTDTDKNDQPKTPLSLSRVTFFRKNK